MRYEYGFTMCKRCLCSIPENSGRGRPREYCKACYEKRKKGV